MPPSDLGVTDEQLAFWSEALTADANRTWIAEESTECVGFLVAGMPVHEDLVARPVLELIALYLLPKVWGRGIADELHECFVELLLAKPAVQEGALDVWSGNLRALSFYRRHGWTPDRRSRPGPAGQPYVGLRLPTPKGA